MCLGNYFVPKSGFPLTPEMRQIASRPLAISVPFWGL